MKKLRNLWILLLLSALVLSVLTACSPSEEIKFRGKDRFSCGMATYTLVDPALQGALKPLRAVQYRDVLAVETDDDPYPERYTAWSSEDRSIVFLSHEKAHTPHLDAPNCHLYVTKEGRKTVEAFARGEYASYLLGRYQGDSHYSVSPDLFGEESFRNETCLVSWNSINLSSAWILWGYDEQGFLCKPLGAVFYQNRFYVYCDFSQLEGFDYSQTFNLSARDSYPCRVFSSEAQSILRKISKETPVSMKVTTEESLPQTLYRENPVPVGGITVVSVSAAVVLLCLLFCLWFFLVCKGDWSKASAPRHLGKGLADGLRALIRKLFAARYAASDAPEQGGEASLKLNLTKEDLLRHNEVVESAEESAEGEATEPTPTLRYCPSCGAPCNWSNLRCTACGAPLDVRGDGSRMAKYNPMVKGKAGPLGGYVVDLSAVSLREFYRTYCSDKLRKGLNRNAVYFYLIAVLYGFSFFSTAVELLAIFQSWIVAGLFFLVAGAFVGLAVWFHARKSVIPPILFGICSLISVSTFFLSLGDFFYALPEGTPGLLVAFAVGFSALIEIVPVILSGLGIYRAFRLRDAYRRFRNGQVYQ